MNVVAEGADQLIERVGDVVTEAERILQAAKTGVRARIEEAGGMDAAQHAAHGLAWLATTVEGIRQMQHWAAKLKEEGRLGEMEKLLLAAAAFLASLLLRGLHQHKQQAQVPEWPSGVAAHS